MSALAGNLFNLGNNSPPSTPPRPQRPAFVEPPPGPARRGRITRSLSGIVPTALNFTGDPENINTGDPLPPNIYRNKTTNDPTIGGRRRRKTRKVRKNRKARKSMKRK